MTHIDLFAGIGGFSLGAKLSDIDTLECVEINAFRRSQLNIIHNGQVKLHDDIKTWKPGQITDIVTMGFPCQDISAANANGKGLQGERSGLFWIAWEKVMQIRPKYIIMENVANLLNRGIYELFATIAESGYFFEWHIVRATNFGLPHERERIYIIAYIPNSLQDRRSFVRICQPFKIDELLQAKEANEIVSFLATCRLNGFRDIDSIQRGNVVPNIRKFLAGYGDAVPPIIAYYFFECIKHHIKYTLCE